MNRLSLRGQQQQDFDGLPTRYREMHPHLHYINEAGVPEVVAQEVLRRNEIASSIETWMRSIEAPQRTFDVFNRSRRRFGEGKQHIFAQMAACADAVENDDILSTLADVVEGLAFQKMRFECVDEDQQDVWNQIGRDLDLDSRLREMWRELFKVSQMYCGVLWERRQYTVRTPPEIEVPPQIGPDGQPIEQPAPPKRGNRNRKKAFSIVAPTALTIFDPTKIVPVGTLLFGRERFAYLADENENVAFGRVLGGHLVDEMVLRLVERKYRPSDSEAQLFANMDIHPDRLWLLQEDAVFRHTLTKASYERWAAIRLKSALEIVELKQHLRASDRAVLVANTNFIVVIKKGSDKLPAKPIEIENLKEQARVVARMPILVGDHRLSVEIVTPPTDHTLSQSRYEVLDARLAFKALNSYEPTVQSGNSSGGKVSEMSMIIARGMENRRHELMRTLEAELFRRTVERNSDVKGFDEVPSLRFTPKRVSLDFNQHVLNAILKVRDRGDLSRETMLEELDYDQEQEAQRRAREAKDFDPVFRSAVPHSSPNAQPFGGGANPEKNAPSTSGNGGGRPPGVTETGPRGE